MEPGGGHFQGSLGVILPPDVAQIGAAGLFAVPVEMDAVLRVRGYCRLALQVGQQLRQRIHGIHAHSVHQGRFGRVNGRHVDRGDALVPRHRNHRQDAGGVPQPAVQRQLAEEYRRLRGGWGLSGAEQYSHRDGEIVGRPGFLQVCRRQVHRDAPHGELATAVAQRRPHPLLGLLYRRVRQADDVERRQSRRNVRLRLNDLSVQSNDGARLSSCQHTQSSVVDMNPAPPAVHRHPIIREHTFAMRNCHQFFRASAPLPSLRT